jgi:O-antigen/teichoic acid export membrane protein
MENLKKNTIYISLMQLILLIVNLLIITLISRNYGAEVYGEYASAKSFSVLIGTAAVLSLALVVTRDRAKNQDTDLIIFANSYSVVLENLLIAILVIIPASLVLNRNLIMSLLFLFSFVINELIHIALAYFQSKGDFVTSSKQIIYRTLAYGTGSIFILSYKISIFYFLYFQVFLLFISLLYAHYSIPEKNKKIVLKDKGNNKKQLRKSGKKMVLTTLSSALISEFDILLLALFYNGSILGVLAWTRRILEILFQIIAASLDIIFPELSKEINSIKILKIRKKLFIFSVMLFSIPLIYYFFVDLGTEIFTLLLGSEFKDVSKFTFQVLFALPLMVWSRVNIIYARALNYEIKITKAIFFSCFLSIGIYYFLNSSEYNFPIISIIMTQLLLAIVSTLSIRKSYA